MTFKQLLAELRRLTAAHGPEALWHRIRWTRD